MYYTEKSLILRIAKLGVFFSCNKITATLYIGYLETCCVSYLSWSYIKILIQWYVKIAYCCVSKCDTVMILNGFDRLFIGLLPFIKEIIRESRMDRHVHR